MLDVRKSKVRLIYIYRGYLHSEMFYDLYDCIQMRVRFISLR